MLTALNLDAKRVGGVPVLELDLEQAGPVE